MARAHLLHGTGIRAVRQEFVSCYRQVGCTAQGLGCLSPAVRHRLDPQSTTLRLNRERAADGLDPQSTTLTLNRKGAADGLDPEPTERLEKSAPRTAGIGTESL